MRITGSTIAFAGKPTPGKAAEPQGKAADTYHLGLLAQTAVSDSSALPGYWAQFAQLMNVTSRPFPSLPPVPEGEQDAPA